MASAVHAALDGDTDAVKLSDEYDSTGRKLTAVDVLIDETIRGDVRLMALAAGAACGTATSWVAVARDLARQVIDAEAEIAELDEKVEENEADSLDDTEDSSDHWRTKYLDGFDERLALADLLQEEERAHCDTYVEAVRLSEELAGWQDSSHAEYRRSTAAGRLEAYRKAPVAYDVGAGF